MMMKELSMKMKKPRKSGQETSEVDKKDDVTEDDTAESDDEDSYVETILNDVFNEYKNYHRRTCSRTRHP